jgi:hypothetical protein
MKTSAQRKSLHKSSHDSRINSSDPNVAGNNPIGMRNMVYIMIWIAVFMSFLPPDGSNLNPLSYNRRQQPRHSPEVRKLPDELNPK